MNMLMSQQWIEFKHFIKSLPENANAYDLGMSVIQGMKNWEKKFPDIFIYPSFVKLKKYLALDLNQYPVEYSAKDKKSIQAFIKHLDKFEAKDRNSIARWLDNTLTDIIVFQIEPTDETFCEQGEIGIYKNKINNKLVYKCFELGTFRYIDGTKEQILENDLCFATRNDLKINNIII